MDRSWRQRAGRYQGRRRAKATPLSVRPCFWEQPSCRLERDTFCGSKRGTCVYSVRCIISAPWSCGHRACISLGRRISTGHWVGVLDVDGYDERFHVKSTHTPPQVLRDLARRFQGRHVSPTCHYQYSSTTKKQVPVFDPRRAHVHSDLKYTGMYLVPGNAKYV